MLQQSSHSSPIVLKTKQGERVLQQPLSIFGQSHTGQLYFMQVAQCFSASAIPVALQMASDRLAPRVFAPVLKENRSGYYVSTKMPLQQYQKKILQDRNQQIQAIRDKEFRDQLLALAGAAMDVLSMVIPYTRIGELFVTTFCLTIANIGVHVAKGIEGSQEATQAIFEEDLLGLLFECEGLKKVMPGWAKFAFEAKGKASTLFTGADEKQGLMVPQGVPADSILDQIYRFRCFIDPTLPRQIETAIKNNQRLMAAILAWK